MNMFRFTEINAIHLERSFIYRKESRRFRKIPVV
jgi:hypothetical protein